MRVILHVGTDKTGSTSLQKILNANKPELLKNNAYYSVIGSDWHNDKALFRAFCSEFDVFPETKEADKEESRRKGKEYLTNLKATLSTLKADDTLIISHEGLMNLSKGDLGRLVEFINNYVEDVKVVLYARDVVSYAVSAKSQRIKTGRKSSAFKPPYIKYARILNNLESAFGQTNIEVRKYRSDAGFDIVADFFESKWFEGDVGRELKPVVSQSRNYSLNSTSYAVASSIPYLSGRGWNLVEFKDKFLDVLGEIEGRKLGLSFIEKSVLHFFTREHQNYLSEYGVVFSGEDTGRGVVGVDASYSKALFLARSVMSKKNVPVKRSRFVLAVIVFFIRDVFCSPRHLIR